VKYLEREYGYQLYAIIGHSMGMSLKYVIIFHFLVILVINKLTQTFETGNISSYHYATRVRRNIPHLVAISARYHFSRLLRSYPKEYLKNFKNEGFIINEYKFYGKVQRVMTTYESFSNFISTDMSFGKCLS
jgi:hypothetical protein